MAHEDDYKQSSHMPSFLIVICQHKKKVVCHNCKLLRYFRNSTSVIYISKLLSVSSSVPCILLILIHLKGLCQNNSFDAAS